MASIVSLARGGLEAHLGMAGNGPVPIEEQVMRDEIDGRLWAEHGHAFSEGVARLFGEISLSLERLHALQFDAPWRRPGIRSRDA